MTNLSTKAKRTARRLRSEYRQIRSWRKLAERYPPIVTPRTLNRVAISLKREGEQWYPKSEEIQLAIGMITPRKPRIVTPLEEQPIEKLYTRRDRLARQLEHIDGIIQERTS